MSIEQDHPNMSRRDLLAHYEQIIEISLQLNSTFDLMTLLKQIVSAATSLIYVEAASILLLDSSTGQLHFAIASNIKPHQLEKIAVPLDGSIAGWIVRHGEPRVIEDVSVEPTHFLGVDKEIKFQTRNLLGVPMRTHDKVIGVIQAVNKLENEKFTDDDIITCRTLASQASIAIENARLFQQSDFIAEMVHELRTPLAALKASTTLLQHPSLPDEKRTDIVGKMRGETERLIEMTSEFLDVARLESGREQLNAETVVLEDLLLESVEIVQEQAKDKGVEILIDDSGYVADADRGKVKRVILNLLTNAIKYNRPDGQIRINAEAASEADHEHPFVRIAVTDTGYGIPEEHLKNMFQKFFRVPSTAHVARGTGLGLAICKNIIEAHGGHIWLESEVDVGTTFFFTIPLHYEN